MFLKSRLMSVYVAGENGLSCPLIDTGAYRSTLPSSDTCARKAGSEDRPVTAPCNPSIEVEKFGSTEWSVKSAAPSRMSTRLIWIGMPVLAVAWLGPVVAFAGPAAVADFALLSAFATLVGLALVAVAPGAAAADAAAAVGAGAPAGRSASDTLRLPLAPMITRP